MSRLQESGHNILTKGMCKIFHHHKGLIIKTLMGAINMFMWFIELQPQSSRIQDCLITIHQRIRWRLFSDKNILLTFYVCGRKRHLTKILFFFSEDKRHKKVF